MRPKVSPALYILLGVACLAMAGASLGGCTQTTRADTLHDVAVGITSVRDGWLTYSETEQHKLVQSSTSRDDAKAKVAAFQAKAQVVDDAIQAAYQAVIFAWAQNDKLSLTDAMEKGAALVHAIQKFKADLEAAKGATAPPVTPSSSSASPPPTGGK